MGSGGRACRCRERKPEAEGWAREVELPFHSSSLLFSYFNKGDYLSAEEALVQQHAKVAEEAVLGWENVEKDVATLKQQLEAAMWKNSALEDKIGHINGALKECVRQLWQSKEEGEQRIHDALIKKTLEWESDKFKLESQLIELQTQLEAKAEVAASVYHEHCAKVEALEKENMALKDELLACFEHLKLLILERESSTNRYRT